MTQFLTIYDAKIIHHFFRVHKIAIGHAKIAPKKRENELKWALKRVLNFSKIVKNRCPKLENGAKRLRKAKNDRKWLPTANFTRILNTTFTLY